MNRTRHRMNSIPGSRKPSEALLTGAGLPGIAKLLDGRRSMPAGETPCWLIRAVDTPLGAHPLRRERMPYPNHSEPLVAGSPGPR